MALLHLHSEPDKSNGHLALGVAGNYAGDYFEQDGKKYYYAESTGSIFPDKPNNLRIGLMPSEFREREVDVYVVR